MSACYIGLMSGTSMDGIDAALVAFTGSNSRLIASHSHPIPEQLKERLKLLSVDADPVGIDMLGEVDSELGQLFAAASLELLKKADYSTDKIRAIGSHGQTVRHRPDLPHRFTLQIGDPNLICYRTGITTVSDFRRMDMAAGGEGAPLAPAFHKAVFYSEHENRAVLNIGGIANLTRLSANSDAPCTGFDTGPGNGLMDAWIHTHKDLAYDRKGEWAASGVTDSALLKQLLSDPYFKKAIPKSTGKEYFNLSWLTRQLKNFSHLSNKSIQATLCEFTARSIADALTKEMPEAEKLIVCGGGIHNLHLMERLEHHLDGVEIESSEIYGIHPDWVEAIAFAWLAKQTLEAKPGNLPSVTGAERSVILGAIYTAS